MKSLEPKLLQSEFSDILSQVENDHEHYFITGRAGSGKSTLLSLLKNTTHRKTVVLAPTGIAALNVKGQTIHSFFKFPPKMIQPSEIRKLKSYRLYKNIETIIIDEISMVRADMMDNIDIFLRKNREINLPFGGVKMIFFGDLFQLPPVIASNFEREYLRSVYASPYFFSSKVLERSESMHMIELNHVFRQTEVFFVKLLDRIRLNEIDMEDLHTMNERYIPNFDTLDMYVHLCSTNASAKAINQKKLQALDERSEIFEAKVTGKFKANVAPTEVNLLIKKHAQVMFVKNDPLKRFVNGTIGKILHIEDPIIKVTIEDNGKESVIEVERMEWEIINYVVDPENPSRFKTQIVGMFTQFPIKLAWAMTIHKSQGKTFEKVIVDLGRGAFDYGQTYVALSRCKTLGGIVLKQKLKPKDIMIDQTIVDYYDTKSRYW